MKLLRQLLMVVLCAQLVLFTIASPAIAGGCELDSSAAAHSQMHSLTDSDASIGSFQTHDTLDCEGHHHCANHCASLIMANVTAPKSNASFNFAAQPDQWLFGAIPTGIDRPNWV